jgi:hypothetical protein
MLRAFLGGLGTMLGWRVGEAVVSEARREFGRAGRLHAAKAQAAFDKEIEACARELPGGTPATAIVVVSSSQIEPHARSLSCIVCDQFVHVEQHRASTIDGLAVRVLDLTCRSCGTGRVVHFRIQRPS